MRIFPNFKIRNKILVASVFIVLVATGLVVSHSQMMMHIAFERIPADIEMDKTIMITQTYKTIADHTTLIGIMLKNDPILISTLEKGAFGATDLQAIVSKHINKLISEISDTEHGKLRLRVYNHDGICVSVKQSRANPNDYRDLIQLAHRTRKQQTAIEFDDDGFMVRGVTPILSNDSAILGTIEVSLPLDQILQVGNTHDSSRINENYDDLAIFVKKQQFEKAYDLLPDTKFERIEIGDYVLAGSTALFKKNNITAQLLDEAVNKKNVLNEQNPFRYTIFPIHNENGKLIAIAAFQYEYSGYNGENVVGIAHLISVIIALIIGVLIMAGITNRVSKNIGSINQFVVRIGNGNFADDLVINSNDEIGDMSLSLNAMVKKVQQTVDEIKAASNIIADSSKQLNYTAQMLAQGANEQAASTEEISSAMEQMTATVNQNSENAQLAARISLRINEKMEEVQSSFKNSHTAITEIHERNKMINEIAERIDILAINAAIEAARAGEFGKGFNVVAAEIRELAEHTQSAASKVHEVSKRSIDMIVKTSKILNSVLPEINQSSSLVSEITAASIEQNTGIGQVNMAMQQLSAVVMNNSSTSEEMAASSEELDTQAQKLVDITSFFKTQIADEQSISVNELKKQIALLHELISSKEQHTSLKKPQNIETKGVIVDLNDRIDKEFEVIN